MINKTFYCCIHSCSTQSHMLCDSSCNIEYIFSTKRRHHTFEIKYSSLYVIRTAPRRTQKHDLFLSEEFYLTF
ncbi:hypothetical protein PUN28_006422 [Cardiocondyla obscurior]|uniref:Uncharacterized protein n=1 Tax=Cardiocondyla obscurior TaxID=286306 RepID=A0AAW2GAB9_9HYME